MDGNSKTTGTSLIATGVAAPVDARPAPERVPVGSARELSWLADSSFPELSEL